MSRSLLVERLEERIAQAVDIAVTSAIPSDSRSIEFTYELATGVEQPIRVAFHRSADDTADAGDQLIGVRVLSGGELAAGEHRSLQAIMGGLPIDPARPFVLVVADPDNALGEANEANNAASFRKYVVGAVTHGLQLDTTFPAWVPTMADSLEAVGYDTALAFDWSNRSALPVPGQAVKASRRMAEAVLDAVQRLPADAAAVDLHLIGHSRGGVVIDQAMRGLELIVQASTAPLVRAIGAGFAKLTFLDAHPAHNVHSVGAPDRPVFSASSGPLGRLATRLYRLFQSGAQDPDIVVPASVDAAEVYFQHTDHRRAPRYSEQILNIWGEVPIVGATHVCDLTALSLGHNEVEDWYQANVVPSLGTATGFICPRPSVAGAGITAARGTRAERLGALSEFRLLAPGLIERPRVAVAVLRRAAFADAAFARGRTELGGRLLASLVRVVEARRGEFIGPEAADLLSEVARFGGVRR